MLENIKDSNEQQPNANLSEGIYFLGLLFKHKIFIILTVVIITATSVAVSLVLPEWYKATVNAVPPQSSGSMLETAMGSLKSTLKDIGLSKVSGKSEGYSLLVILNSRSIKDSIINRFELGKVYGIPENEIDKIRKAFEENIEIVDEKDGNYLISVYDKDPVRAAEMANAYIDYFNSISLGILRKEASVNRNYLESRAAAGDSALRAISDSLEKFSRKYMIFSPQDQAQAVAKSLADLKAASIQNEIAYDIMRLSYGDNDPYTIMQRRILDETRTKLSQLENKPGFAGNFALKNATEVGIEFIRLYAEYETYTQVKAFILPMIEKAKLDEQSSELALFMLDEAEPPQRKDRPKRSLIVLGAFVGSLVIAVSIVTIIGSYRRFKIKYEKIHKTL